MTRRTTLSPASGTGRERAVHDAALMSWKNDAGLALRIQWTVLHAQACLLQFRTFTWGDFMNYHCMFRCLLALLLATTWSRAGAEVNDRDATELRQMTQALLDAVAPGDTKVWERILHERFVHMDENGVVRGKQELLKELRPLPPGLTGRIAIDTFRAEFHHDTAITAYQLQEFLDYHGQPLRSRFRGVDTWLRTSQGWQLAAQHTAAELKDPPAVTLPLAQPCEYAGTYALTGTIRTSIRCESGGLVAEREGRPSARYSAELRDVFFVPGQPRTRRIFQRDDAGKLTGFVDRREGEDVRWERTSGRAAEK